MHEGQEHELGESARVVLHAGEGAQVETISIHSAVGSLPFVSTQRTSSSRISAAVPGIVSSPASFAAVRNSANESPVRAAPLTISMGLNACRCISG